MKIVRLENNVVREIIPEYAQPVEQWYGVAFAADCVEAPDEVEQQWVHDPATQTFAAPVEPEAGPAPPDDITQLQLALAELAAAQEEQQTATELAIAELADTLMGGTT